MFALQLVFGFVALARSELGDIPTKPAGNFHHFQSFSDPQWPQHWQISKLANYTGEWTVEEAAEPQALVGEKVLVMKKPSSYYGISTKFDTPLDVTDKTLVVQYEVRFQEPLECGGAYLKIFGNENFEPETLCNETRYAIMFGPDKCGPTNKVHFIFRHRNPISGEIEEKHMKDAPSIKNDKLTHLYTLIVRPDNTFEILIDGESVRQGSLLADFLPSVNPPKEIDDPTDVKPEDWVDEEMIPDPEAVKPEDWDETQPEYIPDPEKLEAPEGWLVDEPLYIPDPSAVKSEDWDDDIHGEWEAPTIPNPKCEAAPGCGKYEAPVIKNPLYKGKWRAPMIKNPAFKGVWAPRKIPNPNYFEDKHPHNFVPLVGAGFELWMVNKEVAFNNIFIGTDEAAIHEWNRVHFTPKHKAQAEALKKLEPESNATLSDIVSKITGFAMNVKDAVMNLYNENAVMTIVLGSVVVLIPILVCFISCCRTKPVPAKPIAKVEEKAAQEEVTEEKPSEEEEKTEEKPAEEEEEKEEKVERSSPSGRRTPRSGARKADNF